MKESKATILSCSHPMSRHQTITLHSEAGGSIDSISPPPPPNSSTRPTDVAVILKLHSGYIVPRGGKMTVATSNTNVLGVITDTASFSFLLIFFSFFPSLSHLFPEAIRHDACHDRHASTPSPRQAIKG